MPDQDQPRNHDARVQVQGRHHRRRRLEGHRWELHRSVRPGDAWEQLKEDGQADAAHALITASGTVKKVIEINKFLLGTMAGGAGAFWSC